VSALPAANRLLGSGDDQKAANDYLLTCASSETTRIEATQSTGATSRRIAHQTRFHGEDQRLRGRFVENFRDWMGSCKKIVFSDSTAFCGTGRRRPPLWSSISPQASKVVAKTGGVSAIPPCVYSDQDNRI
jgi:hypothetical protein